MADEKIAPDLVIAGRYRVLRELGRGAVGSVHLVQHVHTDEQFALKALHDPAAASPEKIARFRVEARAPARIDSDHVVRITDADVAPELGNAPFFVMEYLRGHDLGAELELRGKLHPAEVVLYLRQAARALDKAHALGIIHRDLKPENLFLTEREDGVPWIKLVDFGIAKLTGDAASIAHVASRTQTGRIFGTPLFMAPEQATGRVTQIGPATDVWALGLVANKLLSGIDHFEADTVAELIGKIAYDPIKPPSALGVNLGKAYDAWFSKCCNRELAKRFRSAGEAVTALAAALRIEENDALVDQVMALRRSQADLALRETVRAPSNGPDIGEASTLDDKKPQPDAAAKALPPPPALPASLLQPPSSLSALAPPPLPRLPQPALLPMAPPPVPPPPPSSFPAMAPPPVPPSRVPAAPPSSAPASMVGSASPMARTALDLPDSAQRERYRGFLLFGVSVATALGLGLSVGLLILRPGTSADPPPAPSAAPAAPPPAPTPRPTASSTPATSASARAKSPVPVSPTRR
jgi:serine/threonine-protein kinase